MIRTVNLGTALSTFDELWSPRIVARYDGHDVRVAKFHGEYVWHSHGNTDELFLVVAGELVIHVREPGGERRIVLGPGELTVVPRGVQHRPVTAVETHVLLMEPSGTVTTGDAADVPAHIVASTGHDLTAT